ncbi:helix-turn-helix domain-containing protein [Paraburkholderia caribensis]|uniref:helix-turn-helix domain-containing protein n=1 Tax=Paraburkholderia caribensis TaxID=75105 RepID=UPI0031E1F441
MQANQSNAQSRLAALGIEPVVTTDEAAAVINRKPQTLRKWACLENGPIRPVRINGRLAWRVADLRALIEGNEPRPIAA